MKIGSTSRSDYFNRAAAYIFWCLGPALWLMHGLILKTLSNEIWNLSLWQILLNVETISGSKNQLIIKPYILLTAHKTAAQAFSPSSTYHLLYYNIGLGCTESMNVTRTVFSIVRKMRGIFTQLALPCSNESTGESSIYYKYEMYCGQMWGDRRSQNWWNWGSGLSKWRAVSSFHLLKFYK